MGRTAVTAGAAAVAKVGFAAGTGTVVEAADISVFTTGAGTAIERATFTVFKARVVMVCELGAVTLFEGGAGSVTATGAETEALTKRGTGAVGGVGSFREAGGIVAAGTEVATGTDVVTATGAGAVPGIDAITSSGAGIETGAGAALVNASGMMGLSTDLRCAMIAASCRLFMRRRAMRARYRRHQARECLRWWKLRFEMKFWRRPCADEPAKGRSTPVESSKIITSATIRNIFLSSG